MQKMLRIVASATPKAEWGAWIYWALCLCLMVGAVEFFFPALIPYEFAELWETRGEPMDWLKASTPILAWAGGFTLLVSLFTRNSHSQNIFAERYLASGLWLSLRAGVMEEIVFRWLIFMWAIACVRVGDFLLGGFAFGHGLLWWINVHILMPIADFTSLGLLHPVFMQSAWFIGAAVIFANVKFRDGHKYQGLFGLINSWFIGLYFFYLMFAFGLKAAILVHFVYDAIIFAIRYLDSVSERRRY